MLTKTPQLELWEHFLFQSSSQSQANFNIVSTIIYIVMLSHIYHLICRQYFCDITQQGIYYAHINYKIISSIYAGYLPVKLLVYDTENSKSLSKKT